MGTMPYMAPEQVQGHDVDARADLFAFGAILYEMVTGERAFAADSKWIDQSLREPDSGAAPAIAPAASRRGLFAAGGILLTAAVALTVLLVNRFATREAPTTAAPAIYSRVRLPDGVSLSGWGTPILSLSPDGRILAVVGRKDGVAKLFVHRLDRDQTIEVPDSAHAEGPFFSPDAQWIAFAVGVSGGGIKGELKKYSLATGLTQSIAGIGDFFGGAWRADGTIFFMGSQGAHLQKVRAEGGTPEPAVAAIRSTGRKVGSYGYRPQLP
jgi:eukaryotic-like serine/threonine-protein kinase